MANFDVTKYTSSKAKPLPIILLLDESNSMSGDKIERLNEAVNKMLTASKRRRPRPRSSSSPSSDSAVITKAR